MSNHQPIVLALDAGTTSVRCIAFDLDGNVIHQSNKPLALSFPKPGWVETDAIDLWKGVHHCLTSTWKSLEQLQSKVIGIGLTNQRETIVAWDAVSGEVLYPAISWQDRRTVERCLELKSTNSESSFNKLTGLAYDPYFSCSKIEWLINHVDSVMISKKFGSLRIGTVDTWLIWQLTAGLCYATDPTNACRTGLFNINFLDWDHDLIHFWTGKGLILPEVIFNDKPNFYIKVKGLPELPLLSTLGDQQASAYGHNCLQTGQTKITYGTGCFLIYSIGEKPIFSNHGLITTLNYAKTNSVLYALEGSIFVGGSLIEWMIRNNWITHQDDLKKLYTRPSDPRTSLQFVPAFSGLTVPFWDPQSSGTIIGITLDTKLVDFVSAAINSIAFQVNDVVKILEKETKHKPTIIKVDGGLSQFDELMQFQSDLCNVSIYRTSLADTTSWGVAKLAFENFGLIPSSLADKYNEIIFDSKMSNVLRIEHLNSWNRAVKRSQKWFT